MIPPFPLPVLFTAWTWQNGAGIAGEVIRRANLGGFRTVAVELSEDTGGDPGSTLNAQDVEYLKGAGLFVVGWGPVGAADPQKLAELGCDGWLPQVEGPGQRDALIALLKSGVPALPRALVTTYGGLDTTADVKALVDAWGGMPFTFVECYAADDPIHAQVDRMLSQGYVYGFGPDSLRALIGTYRGEMPANYTGLNAADYGGAYLEESMNDTQLTALAPFAALVPPPTPEPTVTNDSAARKAEIEKIAEEWLANFGPAPLTRLAVIDRIAKSGPEWEGGIRQDIVDALDGKTAATREQNTRLIAQNADLQRRIEAARNDLG